MIKFASICLGISLAFAGSVNSAESLKLDGEIFLKDFSDPNAKPLPEAPDTTGEYGEGKSFITSAPAPSVKAQSLVYERQLARWLDPFTVPHTRSVCVKWAKGKWPWGGSWKTCVGWKTQFQYMYVSADLRVSVEFPDITLERIRDETNFCLATGAVAAAVSAIYTGGSAAAQAFSAALYTCLEVRFATATIRVETPTSSRWGGWV